MRFKLFSLLAVPALLISFSTIASAQYMTQDLVFVKVGYIPAYNVSFTEKDGNKPDNIEANGFAVQGEYNLNFNGFWLGFGLEYQYIIDDSGSKNVHDSFLLPMASVKVAAVGGLYVGGGVAGKYLIATESVDGVKAKKDIDLWVNGIIGYHFPIGEGIFMDFEGRFGWNLTNRQFSEAEYSGSTIKLDPKHAYDIAFYAGIGFRAFGSNY